MRVKKISVALKLIPIIKFHKYVKLSYTSKLARVFLLPKKKVNRKIFMKCN
jgi:hypothetical protein